ncbi:MAG: hypothetical protein MHMPM18_003245 [Marteilia pararefringens]
MIKSDYDSYLKEFNNSNNPAVLILSSETIKDYLNTDGNNILQNIIDSKNVHFAINYTMPMNIDEYEARLSVLDNCSNQRQNIVLNLVSLDKEIELANYIENFANSLSLKFR